MYHNFPDEGKTLHFYLFGQHNNYTNAFNLLLLSIINILIYLRNMLYLFKLQLVFTELINEICTQVNCY